MPKRWQKLAGFAMALGGVGYAIYASPGSASAIVIGGVVPLFVTFVTGNVKEHQARLGAASAAGPAAQP